MRRIKLTIAYDGTDYCGWQIQPNGITVEEVLNKKLKKLVISGKKLRTVGTKAFSSGQSGKIIVKAVKGKQKKYCRLLRKAGMKSKIRVS